MSRHPRSAPLPLKLVTGSTRSAAHAGTARVSDASSAAYELDWSILMAHAQDGDREAYRRLLSAIAPYIRSLVVRQHADVRDIEDVVQDVLLSVHAVRHTYDPNRPFGPWLVAITHRRIVDRQRRERRHREHEVPLDDDRILSSPAPNPMDRALHGRMLGDALERLPPSQREAVRLLKLQQMSLKEASAITGSSVGALKVSVHRALKTLRKLLVHGNARP